MRFELLGPLGVHDGDLEVRIPPGRQRSLLALLLTRARRTVTTDRMIDALWHEGELPSDPANTVQGLVSRLRKATAVDGVQRLHKRGAGYTLDVPAEDIDAQRFEQLSNDGRRALASDDPDGALVAFTDALALWRGAALEDVQVAPWAAPEVQRLEEQRLTVVEERINTELILGRHAALVPELEELVASHPLRERLRGLLMLALYRSGRQADALVTYQQGYELLVEELGIEPEVRLRELHQRILEQSPDLDLRPRRPAVEIGSREGAPERGPAVIGRAAELGALLDAWTQARGGRGSVALIAGEPGMGKSHLVSEFAASVLRSDGDVRWGHCLEHEGAPPFWPWVQTLRGLIDDLDDETLARVVGSGAADVAQLVPEIADRLPDVGPPVGGDPAHARFRLYDAVCRMLSRLAAERPLVTVVEDIHWSDAPSLELLGVLATNLRTSPLMLVATYRDGDAGPEAPLTETLARLTREPVVQRHVLRGLSRDDVSELLAARLGAAPSNDLVDAIHGRTDGNPFFVSELVNLLGQDLDPAVPVPAELLRAVIPSGVRDVIERRVSVLPMMTRDVLDAASVAGREFRIDTLAAGTSQPVGDVLAALEPAVQAGLVAADDGSLTTYRFAHALVRDAVYARLPALTRARTHARVGEALDALGDDRRLAQVAHHFEQAVPLGFGDRAVDVAIRATDHAERTLAFEQAEQHLRRGLRVLETHGSDRQRELEVQGRLASLLLRTGGYASPAVAHAAMRARQLAADLNAAPQVVGLTWALWVHTCVRADFAAALRIADDLVADGERWDDPVAIAAGHQARGTTLWHLGRIDAAAAELRAGVAGFAAVAIHELRRRGLQHAAVLGRCHMVHPLWLLGEGSEAQRHLDEAAELARALDDPFEEAFCQLFVAWLATLRGEADAAWDAGQRAADASDDHGFPLIWGLASCLAGWAEAVRGDPRAGADRIEQAIDAVDATGARMLRHFHLGLLAEAHQLAGRGADAARAVDQGLAASRETGEAFHLAALERLQVQLRGADGKGGDITRLDVAVDGA